MKLLTLCFLAVVSLPASWSCPEGIIASYHFKNLAANPAFPDEVRARANESYFRAEEMRKRRKSAPYGQGITEQGGDDQDYEDEQDPAYAAIIAEEEASLAVADRGHPQSGLIPPHAIRGHETSPHERKRRRRTVFGPELEDATNSPQRRQNVPLQRYVYTDFNTCNKNPPYALARIEGSAPSVDREVNNVFTSLQYVYNLYWNVYGRRTFNGFGGVIHGTARYCYKEPNAYWDSTQMFFGEGDDVLFNFGSFTASLTVTGHEVTHGIIQYSNPLKYEGQPGALNEHLADVFGILTTQYAFGQSTATSDWLIGNGIPVGGGALRSMKAPGTAYNTAALGKDNQPADMAHYNPGPEDNFGVHTNSGIPNRAFYLFAAAVGGNAWNIPGHVWYNVLNRGQGQFDFANESFATFAQRTINAANQLYGPFVSAECRRAWRTVGVLLV